MDIDVILDSAGRCPATGIGGHGTGDGEHEGAELRQILAVYDVAERHAARLQHRDIRNAVESLGNCSRKYQRERARNCRAVLSEVYSAPRVTEAARRLPRYGLGPGVALDLTMHDDEGVPRDFS